MVNYGTVAQPYMHNRDLWSIGVGEPDQVRVDVPSEKSTNAEVNGKPPMKTIGAESCYFSCLFKAKRQSNLKQIIGS